MTTAGVTVSAPMIDALVVGVSLLGSGGGGDARAFSAVLRRELGVDRIRLGRPVDLLEHTVVPVGIVGATSVLQEKLPGGHELSRAVTAVGRWSGTPATALMSIEAGGLNGITALVTALRLGLPYLDADLLGRAMPRLDQFTWSVLGQPMTPCALSEPGGQIVIFDDVSSQTLERSVRSFVAQCGGWAAMALRPVSVGVAADNSIIGSLDRALELGRQHARLPEAPSAAVVEHALGATVIGTGRVRGIDRHPGTVGRSSIHLKDASTGAVVRVEAENEYLLALVDGVVAASAPDLLCLLARRGTLPIAVENIRVGDEVMVTVLPGPPWWTARADLFDLARPAGFGLTRRRPGRGAR